MLAPILRRRQVDREGESVFVSMTDLTVSFLFILLILLAFFASNFQIDQVIPRDEHESLKNEFYAAEVTIDRLETTLENTNSRNAQLTFVADQLYRSLSNSELDRSRLAIELAKATGPDSLTAFLEEGFVAREMLLRRLAQLIRESIPGIQITVDTVDGVIRFRADSLFKTGRWRILKGSLAERVSIAVGEALADTLPCYAQSPRTNIKISCKGPIAVIETIQIEGHTDDIDLSTKLQEREHMIDNYDLSARRGAETLRVITRYRPELGEYLNLRGQPVLSFAGYGKTRPINRNDTDEARAQNRRIDIRFILQTPKNLSEVEHIRSLLTRPRTDLPVVLDELQQ